MSGNEERREQAQRLLRSFTDIDDRYIAEAMGQEETGLPEQSGENHEKVESITAGKRRIRNYSRWALTAAACLTVAIIGRYVAIHQKPNVSVEKAATAVEESEEKFLDDVQSLTAESKAGESVLTAGNMAEEPAMSAAASDKAKEDFAQDEMAGPQEMAAEEDAEMYENSMSAQDAEVGGTYMQNETTQIANPFIDAGTLEEAQKTAGFTISLPEGEDPYTTLIYRAVRDEMLEIIYTDREGNEGYRIRKALGEDDISGDYNNYAKESVIRLSDGTGVTVRGEKKDSWSVAVWTAQKEQTAYSYAVCSGGKTFSSEEIRQMAEVILQS